VPINYSEEKICISAPNSKQLFQFLLRHIFLSWIELSDKMLPLAFTGMNDEEIICEDEDA
jgi:hypothetical protein